jgi:glycosyltransferase involved in cell wall biosynthesis
MKPGKAPAPTELTIVVVMPAFNAARTLEMTYRELPHERVNLVILVDDGSSDETIEIARKLNLRIFLHRRNYAYGANQKTCYTEALRANADIIVMVHPDHQYDPKLLPALIRPIEEGRADVVLGSRLMGKESPLKQGMPWWKYLANRFLTQIENWVFGLKLSEYHTGYRAYKRSVLEAINFRMNSDKFVFDQQLIAQVVHVGFRIGEVAVSTRYFPEASSAGFVASCRYGLAIFVVLFKYWVQRVGLAHQRQFQNLDAGQAEISTREYARRIAR